MKPLSIGSCIDSLTNKPCLDFEAERRFVELVPGATIDAIVGLQNSPMFVMAVRGADIADGQNQDAPRVEIDVTRGDEPVGSYASRPVVIPDSESPELVVAPQLYVVAFFADNLEGELVDVRADVTDKNGVQWCAKSNFKVGILLNND